MALSKSVRRYELRRPLRDAAGNLLLDPQTGKRLSEKTGKTVWRARYRDQHGKDHTRHFDRKVDAETWLDGETASLVSGTWVNPQAGLITWDEWVEEWIAEQIWAPGTVAAARTSVESVPWRTVPLNSIDAGQVSRWVTAEHKRGLAASTIRTRLNYVGMAFRLAYRRKKIQSDPSAEAKAPRARRAPQRMKLLTSKEVAAALDEAGRFRPFVAVCAFAGLRLGEAAGLRRGDVDLDDNALTVRRQVQGSSKASTVVVPPKDGSERTVYIPAALSEVLRDHMVAEGVVENDQYLFRTPQGDLYQRNNAAEEWRRIRTAVGLSGESTLHALRHTFASNLIAAGCDVATVQRALGHSSPSITLNTYTHLWPSAEDRTRDATGSLMREVETLRGLSVDSGG